MAKKMMPNMSTYGGQENPGYKPASGSAGRSAKGDYSHDKNPMSVPMKGSAIGSSYGNSDHQKVRSMMSEQSKKESLRGKPC